MTKEQEGAIERLNLHKDFARIANGCVIVNRKDIETVLNMLKEKDKMIDLLVKNIELQQYANIDTTNLSLICKEFKCNKRCKLVKEQCIKKYFERKVEE